MFPRALVRVAEPQSFGGHGYGLKVAKATASVNPVDFRSERGWQIRHVDAQTVARAFRLVQLSLQRIKRDTKVEALRDPPDVVEVIG